MSDDIRWRIGTSGHPKILRLITECGERAFRALTALWEHAGVHHKDGDLSGMDETDIKIAAGWPDADPKFVATLVRLRLIDGKPPRSKIHDWSENQPWIRGHEARSDASLKAVLTRWAARAGTPPEEYAAQCGLNTERIRRVFGSNGHQPPGTDRIRTEYDPQYPSPSPIPSPIPIPIPSPKPTNVVRSEGASLARIADQKAAEKATEQAWAVWSAANPTGTRSQFYEERRKATGG